MIKVNHLQLLPLLTGVQRVSLNEIEQLSASGIEYSVTVSSIGPLTEELHKNKTEFYIVDDLVREISFVKDLKSFFKLYVLFRKEKFDIVHTHSSKTGFLGRLAAKLARTDKIIHTVHGFAFPSTSSKFTKAIYFLMEFIAGKCTDHLIVLNLSDYNIAVNILKIKKSKIFIVPNSVDTDKFKPSIIDNPKNKLKIVMVGRLWKQKNPKCLLKALKIVKEKGGQVSLDFIGDGELKEDLMKYCSLNKIEDNINFIGWKNDIYSHLPKYDLFILPSLWEGMPLAILEAMSCGLPSIVSDIPGNSDLIKSDVNGFLFKSNDEFELAEKIMKYLDKPELLIEHSKQARNLALEQYSAKKRNEVILNLYKK